MFKMVTGNNGRTVYCGKVSGANQTGFLLSGTEYNPQIHQEVNLVYQVGFDANLTEAQKNVKDGEVVLVTFMPSRDDMTKGVAEEIAHIGQMIKIRNEKNNEKEIILAVPRRRNWNEKQNVLTVSFSNLHDVYGNPVGVESKPFVDNFGNTRTTHWLNVTFFRNSENSKFNNRYNADVFEKRVGDGDTICLVSTIKNTTHEGKNYTNHNGAKFFVPVKQNVTPQAQTNQAGYRPAPQPTPAPAQPVQQNTGYQPQPTAYQPMPAPTPVQAAPVQATPVYQPEAPTYPEPDFSSPSSDEYASFEDVIA